jgi:hypothetical protein
VINTKVVAYVGTAELGGELSRTLENGIVTGKVSDNFDNLRNRG